MRLGKLTSAPPKNMMLDFAKPAGERCKYQRGNGCKVYDRRPLCCRLWSCTWLTGEDTEEMPRPDRCHYVIDPLPDVVQVNPPDSNKTYYFKVLQVWVDPKHPDAHKDPHLRAFLERRAQPAIIRYNASDGFVLGPPNVTNDGWQEIQTNGVFKHKLPPGFSY